MSNLLYTLIFEIFLPVSVIALVLYLMLRTIARSGMLREARKKPHRVPIIITLIFIAVSFVGFGLWGIYGSFGLVGFDRFLLLFLEWEVFSFALLYGCYVVTSDIRKEVKKTPEQK